MNNDVVKRVRGSGEDSNLSDRSRSFNLFLPVPSARDFFVTFPAL
jgi:hypothetical protein